MEGWVNMRLLTSLLFLTWWPLSVLGQSYAVVVQTGGGQVKPGDVINYAVSASPVPSWTLGMVLIQTIPDADGGAICWPWTITLSSSPKQGSIRVPSNVPPRLYVIDVHVNASIYSTKLATSNVFEVISNSPPTTQVTSNVVQSTKQTTITTTQQQTVVQQPPNSPNSPNSPQSQPDPTLQNPNSNQPATTQNPVANAPSSNTPANTNNTPANTNAGSTTNQAGSTVPIVTPGTQSAAASTTNPASTASAGSSLQGDPPVATEKKKSSAVGPAVGGAIGGIIIILLLLFLWRRYKKKHQELTAIDDMAETNSRFTDVATPPVTSPFANTFREFQPNRSNTAVSPFLLDSERSQATSPDTKSSKYHEAFGQTHHNNASFSTSAASGAAGTSGQLLSERERALGEISELRSRGSQASPSAYAQSSVSAGSSGGRDAADEEIRNRLDMLTQHVARLENALGEQGQYEAPPTYHPAPSQAASQRG